MLRLILCIINEIGPAISVLSDFILAIAALVGVWGIREWKRETLWKAKFETSRKAIHFAYQFKDDLNNARKPVSPFQTVERHHKEHETPKQKAVLDEEYLRKAQLRPVIKALSDLQEVSWDVKILFGSQDIRKYVEPFERIFKKVLYAMNSYFLKEYEGEGRDTTGEWLIINGGDDEVDDIRKEVDIAIEDLSGYLKKHLH